MSTLRLGPPEIRDPQLRSRATHVQRARFTNLDWSSPGRILYLGGLTDAEANEPPAISIELEIREAVALYQQLAARLREARYIP